MELAQDAPPNPQHRVGTIGGRPSQHHDALRPACRASKTPRGAPDRPPPQPPRSQGAETHRGVTTTRPLNSAATALPPPGTTSSSNLHPRYERAQRNPEQARAGEAEPAGAGPPTGTFLLRSGSLQATGAAQQATFITLTATSTRATSGRSGTPGRRERVKRSPQAEVVNADDNGHGVQRSLLGSLPTKNKRYSLSSD